MSTDGSGLARSRRRRHPSLSHATNHRDAPDADPPSAVTEASDADLVERSRAGDPDAFGLLVRRHYRAAYIVAQQATRDQLDAEDVTQDAFVRALERMEQCRDPARFSAWLHQIIRNVAHDLRDKQRVREAESLDDVEPASRSNPSKDAENADLRERLIRALEQLTTMQRAVLLFFDRDGLSHGEIAAKVGCSVGMSQQHLFAARKTMRRLLGSPDVA